MYGRSIHISPTPAGFVAAAEFYDFAPMSCNCCTFLVSEDQRKRTYAHVYENRIETNFPIAPCCCLTKEVCMQDMISVKYFDKAPVRSSCYFWCFPTWICGQPVIYVNNPKCCCLDMKTCFGQSILASPCDCFGAKQCLCCGNPCYTCIAWPVIPAVSNGEKFLSAMKFAVVSYSRRVDIPEQYMAKFESVEDNIFDFGKAKGLQELKMART